jgi:ABC-type nitrate/sulfonate/bicarbonate transport system permease component
MKTIAPTRSGRPRDPDVPAVGRRSRHWRRLAHRSLRRGQLRTVVMTLAGLVLGVAGWSFLSYFVFNPYLVPPPLTVGKAMIPMIRSGELWEHIHASLIRIVVGFSTGSVAGIVVGLLMGRIRLFRELVDPTVEILRYLSPTAMITIAVIWFGIGETSKYFLVFWGVLFIVLINTWEGVLQVPLIRQRAARCLGTPEWRIFVSVVLPSAVPYIVVGLRVGMMSAFVSIIPAEILAARSGLGFLLQQSGFLAQTERIFVALTVITVLGFLADGLFRLGVSRLLAPYTKWGALS